MVQISNVIIWLLEHYHLIAQAHAANVTAMQDAEQIQDYAQEIAINV